MSFLEILLTKAGGMTIMVLISGAIVIFLRALYGPRGKFREPLWDEWNREAELQEQQRQVDLHKNQQIHEYQIQQEQQVQQIQPNMAPAHWEGHPPPSMESHTEDNAFFAPHNDFFSAYAQSFFSDDSELNAQIQLKFYHTLRVVDLAKLIAATEPTFADTLTRRSLLLGALYHDVGRFEQFRKYRTYSDAASCNHGQLGAKILRRQRILHHEEKALQRNVVAGVCLHNRFSVPAGVTGAMRQILLALRDADKLDILHIMLQSIGPNCIPDSAVVLHFKDEPCTYSPQILAALEEGRVASFSDMRAVNDIRLLLCTWMQDLQFAASRRRAVTGGYFEQFIAGLNGIPEVQERALRVVKRFAV